MSRRYRRLPKGLDVAFNLSRQDREALGCGDKGVHGDAAGAREIGSVMGDSRDGTAITSGDSSGELKGSSNCGDAHDTCHVLPLSKTFPYPSAPPPV